jgi:hypothetical protein
MDTATLLRGKCGFVDGTAPALVIVARFDGNGAASDSSHNANANANNNNNNNNNNDNDDGDGDDNLLRVPPLPTVEPIEDAPTTAAVNRLANARAVALKAALRADYRSLGIAVSDFVHGTVNACEARRDALLLAGVRVNDLAA